MFSVGVTYEDYGVAGGYGCVWGWVQGGFLAVGDGDDVCAGLFANLGFHYCAGMGMGGDGDAHYTKAFGEHNQFFAAENV